MRRDRRKGCDKAYSIEGGCTEAGAAIKPVIVAKLVDLNSSPIRRRMRHRLCRHRQRVFGVHLSPKTIVVQKLGREIQVLLKRELSIRVTKESEGRHVSSKSARYSAGRAHTTTNSATARVWVEYWSEGEAKEAKGGACAATMTRQQDRTAGPGQDGSRRPDRAELCAARGRCASCCIAAGRQSSQLRTGAR